MLLAEDETFDLHDKKKSNKLRLTYSDGKPQRFKFNAGRRTSE